MGERFKAIKVKADINRWFNLKKAVQPRMDTDEHGFNEDFVWLAVNPVGEACRLIIIRVYRCLSVVNSV